MQPSQAPQERAALDRVPSAGSRDLLCKWLKKLAAKGIADTLFEFLGCQSSCRFNHGAFAMNPLWLDAVQPWALDRQPAGNNPHACFLRTCLLSYCLVMLPQPAFDLLTHPAWEALSHMSTIARCPCTWTCCISHCNNSLVTELTGRPAT